MESEREDGQKRMNCLEEELVQTRNNSTETVAETRFDSRHQIDEMEDKVYGVFKKAEETRRAICRQAEKILAQEKEKVAEVRRLDSKNMADNMAEMDGNSAEVIQVARSNMGDMEEKSAQH